MSYRFRRCIVVAAVAALLGSSPPATKAVNLIKNGGFEDWETVAPEKLKRDLEKGHRFGEGPPYLLPEGWRIHYMSKLPARMRRLCGKPGVRVHSGRAALLCQVVDVKRSREDFYLSIPAKLRPGKKYKLSFWAKGDGRLRWTLLQYADNKQLKRGWRGYREHVIPFWENYEAPPFELKKEASHGVFLLAISGSVILDDIVLAEVR